jgi:hypothetical protein
VSKTSAQAKSQWAPSRVALHTSHSHECFSLESFWVHAGQLVSSSPLSFTASPAQPFCCQLHVQDISAVRAGDEPTRHRLVFHSTPLRATPYSLDPSTSGDPGPQDKGKSVICVSDQGATIASVQHADPSAPICLTAEGSTGMDHLSKETGRGCCTHGGAPRSPCSVARSLLNCEDRTDVFWVKHSKRPPRPAGRAAKAARCRLTPVLQSVGWSQEAQVPVEQFSVVTSRVWT